MLSSPSNIISVYFVRVFFSNRLVHQQDNFQQEAHQPILSYSLIQTLYWNELLCDHITSLRLLPCCLVSLILALNTREVFEKPALCIKHQVIRAKQRAQQQLFTCELAGKGSGIMYVKNWLILSYCRSHIHYAAVLYILFLEISYLCISVFVTLTHCYVRNVTEEIDQPLLRCCHISWNE